MTRGTAFHFLLGLAAGGAASVVAFAAIYVFS